MDRVYQISLCEIVQIRGYGFCRYVMPLIFKIAANVSYRAQFAYGIGEVADKIIEKYDIPYAMSLDDIFQHDRIEHAGKIL